MKIQVATGHGVAERWRKQYEKSDGTWGTTVSGSSKDVYEALVALGEAPGPGEVAEVIGNDRWSYLRCGGCARYVTMVVEFGEDPTFGVCRGCLMAGSAAIETVARWKGQRDG